MTVAAGLRGDSDESVACGTNEPAGQGEDVLGKFGRVEYLELGPDDGHVDCEHVGGLGAGVQDACSPSAWMWPTVGGRRSAAALGACSRIRAW